MSLGAQLFPQIRREPTLVSYWRLNDPSGSSQATDYGARFGLNGFYNGSPALGPALIQSDLSAASYLFGTGKSVSVGDAAPLRVTGDISIEAWVVPYSGSQTSALVSKLNTTIPVTANPYFFGTNSGKLTFGLGNGVTMVSVTAPSVLSVSIPSHVVATSFRGVMTIYVNGVSVAIATLDSQSVTDDGQPMFIGEIYSGSSPFNGLIGEVSLYSGALSARRISRHFTIGQQVLSDPSHYSTIDPPSFN